MQDTATKKIVEPSGGNFFPIQRPPNNGAILTVATIIKAVMSLAAEAEPGALKRGGIFMTNTHQDGPPTTANPNPNQQLDSGGVINHKIQPK
jgi:hypothetical protein